MQEQNILAHFRHRFYGRVQTFDVDRQNVVHNAVYLYWLESARIEYFRDIGLTIDSTTFITHHKFVVARTEIDYISPVFFDEEYLILTRIPAIKNTSFVFEQVIKSKYSETVFAKAQSVIVHLHPTTNSPEPIHESYRALVHKYENQLS